MILKARAEKGSAVVGLALLEVLGVVRPVALGGREVERAGQEVDDGVEHRLHALVLEGGPAQDRHHGGGQGGGAQGAAQVVGRDGLLGQVLLHDGVVEVGDDVDELVAGVLGLGGQVLGDVEGLPLLAHVRGPHQGLLLEQVDDALELGLGADGQLNHGRQGVQAVADHLHRALEVGADAVHFVDEADPRHVVLVGLAPHRLGLGLHAGHGVEHGDGAVEDAQRALHLDGEVDVARGVDDVDPVVAPRAGGGGGGDGDAALLLLDHPVHGRGAFVHLTDLVVAPRVIEDALGRGGLARVDVGHDPDVAGLGQREVACGEGFSHGAVSVSCRVGLHYQR